MLARGAPQSFSARRNDVDVAAKELKALAANDNNPFPHVLRKLSTYRQQCEALIFPDIDIALDSGVEDALWDVHEFIHNGMRRRLHSVLHSEGKRQPVQRRKREKLFLDFIKQSQHFYRQYLRRLASQCGMFDYLKSIPAPCKQSKSPTSHSAVRPHAAKDPAVFSCYQTLIHLGDLSRWRETQLSQKTRNWAPARGYYELALGLCPRLGLCFNQLAVISREDGNYFDTMFYFYRAIASTHPHPCALDNLRKLCRIVKSTSQDLLLHPADEPQLAYQGLFGRHVSLHASYCLGDRSEVDALESSVLTQLASAVSRRSFEEFMEKIVLVNLAAEFNAGKIFEENRHSEEAYDTLFSIMRLNLRTMIMLLEALIAKMESPRKSSATARTENDHVPLTAKAQRLIPSIRRYSGWLVSQASILNGDTMDAGLASELGSLYTKMLNLLALHVPSEGRQVRYLLEEDEKTLGFLPLDNPNCECARRRYYISGTRLIAKPRWYDKDITPRDAIEETQARVHDIIADGLFLQRQRESPLRLQNSTFVFGNGAPGSGKTAESSQIKNDVTHISETRLTGPGSMPEEAYSPVSHARQTPFADGADETTQDGVRAFDETTPSEPRLTATTESSVQILGHRKAGNDTTNYGSLPSIATADIISDTVQSRHTGQAVESSMPDPTDLPLSSAASFPRNRMYKRRARGYCQSEAECEFRSSNIFVGSNQELPKETATPTPGQMTWKI